MVGTGGSSRGEQLVKGATDEVMGREVQDESIQHILPLLGGPQTGREHLCTGRSWH